MSDELTTINRVITEHQQIRGYVKLVGDSVTDREALSSLQQARSDWVPGRLDILTEKQKKLAQTISTLEAGLKNHFAYEEKYLPPILGELFTRALLIEHQEINEGDTSSLSWSISDADSFTISPNVFRQLGPIVITEDTPVSVTVSPPVTTSYTLTAINDIGSVDQTITIKVSPQTAGIDWSGTWDTSWGTMYLTQSLVKVTGTYDYQGGKIEGYISNNLSGDILVGTWSEHPSYAPPDDAGLPRDPRPHIRRPGKTR